MKKKVVNFKLTELHIALVGLAIICILQVLAILKGLDGIMFGSSMTAIGVLIGWVFKNFRPNHRGK